MSNGVFVTATDTEVGKTYVSSGLLKAWQRSGIKVAAMKPVASGAIDTGQGLRNADAETLIAHSNVEMDYETMNPYVFAPPIAPHLAALEANRRIVLADIVANHAKLVSRCDRLVVEGVGGWRVPLAPDLDLPDVAKALGHPVLLVVGMRLGCLNHARLSAESIRSDGAHLCGWVANEIEPAFVNFEQNVATLDTLLPAQRLATLKWSTTPGANDGEFDVLRRALG